MPTKGGEPSGYGAERVFTFIYNHLFALSSEGINAWDEYELVRQNSSAAESEAKTDKHHSNYGREDNTPLNQKIFIILNNIIQIFYTINR